VLDLLIDDVLVVDGTGSDPRHGSIGIDGDRVAWLGGGDAPPPAAARTIEGDGRVAAPGFVDVHNHSDLSPLVHPRMSSVLRQGITTAVVGNCGSSPWPLAGWQDCVDMCGDRGDLPLPAWRSWGDYLEALEAARPAVNVGTLVGHGSLRLEAMGLERRHPTPDELATMSRTASEAVRDGALGLSTGLIYVPGIHARTDEVVAIARAVAEAGGLYTSHIRGEGRDLFAALKEAIEIGSRAELPVHVSHLKCESSRVWGRAADALALLRDAGVTADQYPYTAWNSSLSSLLPPWAPVKDLATIVRRDRDRLRAAVEHGEPEFQSSVDGVGWEAIVIVGSGDGRWNGRDLASIARELGLDGFDAMLRLLLEDPDASCIGHAMHEDDVRTIVADPDVFVATDGSAISPEGSGEVPVHPREYGTFPRVLARYVRDDTVLTLPAAIRKMTSLPADRFGLRDRGSLREGAFADVVVLDPDRVADAATFDAPHAYPAGVDVVIVNGQVAWDGGWGAHAGRVLRR